MKFCPTENNVEILKINASHYYYSLTWAPNARTVAPAVVGLMPTVVEVREATETAKFERMVIQTRLRKIARKSLKVEGGG